MSIRDSIQAYTQSVLWRFHTPGHGGRLDPDDITEIDGRFPEDCVRAAERKVAKTYGVKQLRFLVNGSSIGIKAAILACGKPVLCEDIRHRAVDEGAELAKVPLYTVCRRRQDGLSIPPDVGQIERALREHPDVGAVLLTSPDYYGRCIAPEVFDAVRAAGKTLIVDSAHGAHFVFSPLFPPSPCRVADYCNLSAHKTLYAYTQTAYLACNVDPAAVDRALALLGTTSPSYLFLAGLEEAADYAAAADYVSMKRAVDEIKRQYAFADNDDFSRLVLDARPFGTDGFTLYRRLLEKGIAAETADPRYVVLIVTPDNVAGLPQLGAALKECR